MADVVWRKNAVLRPVETVKCYEDNSRSKALSKTTREGKVLVIDAMGLVRNAVLAISSQATLQRTDGLALWFGAPCVTPLSW